MKSDKMRKTGVRLGSIPLGTGHGVVVSNDEGDIVVGVRWALSRLDYLADNGSRN